MVSLRLLREFVSCQLSRLNPIPHLRLFAIGRSGTLTSFLFVGHAFARPSERMTDEHLKSKYVAAAGDMVIINQERKPIQYRTRASPARRVILRSSRCSSSASAYLRLLPKRSRNWATVTLPVALICARAQAPIS